MHHEEQTKEGKEAHMHRIGKGKTHTQHTRMPLPQPESKVMLGEGRHSPALDVGRQTELYNTKHQEGKRTKNNTDSQLVVQFYYTHSH